MTQYNPPIETRETDELILIIKSSTDEWQQTAIDIAKEELKKRGLSQTQINARYTELEKDFNELIETELKNASEEDYSVFEKIWMILFWPRELFHGWHLKRDGYTLKAKRRIQLILTGLIFYIIIILTSI
jgi:hypothetical protein